MLPSIIIGLIFAAIMVWAGIKTKKDLKSSKCAGCSAQGCASRK